MAAIIYPRPLRSGGVIGVPSPSSGVPAGMRGRFDTAVAALESRGFVIDVGALAFNGGLVSGSVAERASELSAFFRRADVRAVVPPWGGDLAIDLVEVIDWDAIAADPTWFVGWSDISTLLLPLTITAGIATLHGANLMDEPFALPAGFERWTTFAAAHDGDEVTQQSASPTSTGWRSLSGDKDVAFSGRLLGGCLDTVSLLAGTRFGDVDGFARRHAPEGLVIYLEAAEVDSVTATRLLTSLRLHGWFDRASGLLIGRTTAPTRDGMSHDDAVRTALGGLGIPVILDFDTGHAAPQMPLVNGALAEIEFSSGSGSIRQSFVP